MEENHEHELISIVFLEEKASLNFRDVQRDKFDRGLSKKEET